MKLKTKRRLRRVITIAALATMLGLIAYGVDLAYSDECTGVLKWTSRNDLIITQVDESSICAIGPDDHYWPLRFCEIGDVCRVVSDRSRPCSSKEKCVVLLGVTRAGAIK